jgi:chymotrypsin/suppressor of tumorigenicity protein 14
MDAPVVLSRSVAPACLPVASTDPDQFVDQDAIILGWGGGTENDGDVIPFPNLQQAKVSIWSNGDCKGDETAGRYVTENTTCITSATGDKFTCTVSQGLSCSS